MQVNISARQGHLSDATRSKITAKVEKLARLFERLLAIEVTVDLEHEQNPIVDMRVSAEHKHDFVAREAGSTPEAAMEQAQVVTMNQGPGTLVWPGLLRRLDRIDPSYRS